MAGTGLTWRVWPVEAEPEAGGRVPGGGEGALHLDLLAPHHPHLLRPLLAGVPGHLDPGLRRCGHPHWHKRFSSEMRIINVFVSNIGNILSHFGKVRKTKVKLYWPRLTGRQNDTIFIILLKVWHISCVSPDLVHVGGVRVGEVTLPLARPLAGDAGDVEAAPSARLPPLKSPQCRLSDEGKEYENRHRNIFTGNIYK